MRKSNWKTKSISTAIAVFLVLVINPEVRAILFFLDFLGADLLLALLGGYVALYWPMLMLYARPLATFVAAAAKLALRPSHLFVFGLLPRDLVWVTLGQLGVVVSVAGRTTWSRLRG